MKDIKAIKIPIHAISYIFLILLISSVSYSSERDYSFNLLVGGILIQDGISGGETNGPEFRLGYYTDPAKTVSYGIQVGFARIANKYLDASGMNILYCIPTIRATTSLENTDKALFVSIGTGVGIYNGDWSTTGNTNRRNERFVLQVGAGVLLGSNNNVKFELFPGIQAGIGDGKPIWLVSFLVGINFI